MLLMLRPSNVGAADTHDAGLRVGRAADAPDAAGLAGGAADAHDAGPRVWSACLEGLLTGAADAHDAGLRVGRAADAPDAAAFVWWGGLLTLIMSVCVLRRAADAPDGAADAYDAGLHVGGCC